MKIIPFLLCLLVVFPAFGQDEFRPYEEWNTIAFCAYDTYHPAHYAQSDNNWEILLALRTPMTPKELRTAGIDITASQIMFLNIGGLIEKEGKKWHTVMPIFDESQTEAIRALSREIAEEAYSETRKDWKTFSMALKESKFTDNAYNIVFSYVIDSKIWKQELPAHEDVEKHATWDGAYWAMYDKRPGTFCGTNGYNRKLYQTWTDSLSWWMSVETIGKIISEYDRYGKINDKELLDEVLPWGLADADGNILVPVIAENDPIDTIGDEIVSKLGSCMYRHTSSFMSGYGITNENLAVTILYHEVMWDLMDILQFQGIITKPDILKGTANSRKEDFAKIVYLVK